MLKHHQEILQEIKKHAGERTSHSGNDSYLSSGHRYYSVSNPVKRKLVRDWVKLHKNLSVEEYSELLDSLYESGSYEEKTSASLLLGYFPRLRKEISTGSLDGWLGELCGWAEVDSLCQSNFTAEDMLLRLGEWEKFIRKLSKDQNINKRRASLVFLTGVVGKTDDPRLAALGFQVINTLQNERDILITKAVSWLLRDLVKLHREKVERYLESNADKLPAIAIRETRNKLKSGRKSGK